LAPIYFISNKYIKLYSLTGMIIGIIDDCKIQLETVCLLRMLMYSKLFPSKFFAMKVATRGKPSLC